MHPADIVKHPMLSRQQKIDLLHDLDNELRELMVADEENMTGSTPVTVTLDDVEAALRALGEESDTYAAPTKHG